MNRSDPALTSSSNLARLIVENATDFAIFTTDLAGLITSWNPGAEKLLGWSSEEAIGQHACMIFTPEDQALDACGGEMRTAGQAGRAEDERWHLRKDGSRFWASGLMMRFEDEHSGEHIGYLKMLRDRTPQHEANERVRASEARYRQIVEGAEDFAIAALDEQGHFTSWNSGAERITGYSAAEALGQPSTIIFTSEDRVAGQPDHELNRTRSGGRVPDERWHLRKDGSRFWGSGLTMRLDQPGGGYLKIFRDRTVEHLGEGRLRHRSNQLQSLAEVAMAVARAPTLEATLDEVTRAARRIIGAHQGVVSLTRGPDWSQAINTVDLTDKYGQWRDYAAATDGTGIYTWVCEENRPLRLSQAELEAHPRWRGFGRHANGHPPMRGWLAAPLVGRDGRNLGLIQLSDKEDGSEFDEADEAMLVQLASLASAAVEQAQAEAALRETSRRLDAILNNTREAVFLMDHRQHCIYANAAAEKLTGYSFAEMQGRPLHDVVHNKKPDGSHYPLEECPIDRAFPERAQMSGEELFVHKDGSFYPVAFTASPMLDDSGQPIGTVIEARGIVEEKAARERLAQLASVVEESRDFIGVADAQGHPVYVNEAGRVMMGLPSLEAACSVGLLDYFAERDRPRIIEEALPTAASEGYWEGETSFRRFDDGREFPVLYNIFPVRGAAGEITHFATVTRDLSERKRTEAELRELNATLENRVEERTRELLAAEEQLRQAQKMEAVGQLTGGLAHDFNNLLTGVIGSLDMMQRRIAMGQTDRIEQYTSAALTSANRAAALTHRLLAFSRRQPLDPKPVNANRLVTGMEELLRRTIGESVRLEIVTAGGLWQTLCDPHQLESAILNLAINARDAMPGGGTLTIETCNAHLDNAYAASQRDVTPGQYVCICVTDTGTGMPKEVVEKAFDPFFTTKPIGQGTGLGLSMIYGFARQSEGYAKIYSEVGQGTTVKLYLPRYYGQAEDAEDAQSQLTDEHRAPHGETVLVVEDEPTVRALIVDVPEELGYRAIEATDGPSGLKVLQSDARIDLLVTDVGLPGLNGRQLADAARLTRPELKVLFITGYAENAAIASGFLEPGMQMITKPFAIETLATRLRSMIEDEGRASSSRFVK